LAWSHLLAVFFAAVFKFVAFVIEVPWWVDFMNNPYFKSAELTVSSVDVEVVLKSFKLTPAAQFVS